MMDTTSSTLTSSYFADAGLLLFALFLVLLNGFFVAAEFAMVKLRDTRVASLSVDHGWRGHILRKVHNQLDAYLSACQLGITLASLGLGWVGEPAFAHLLEPLFRYAGIESPALQQGLAFFLAFFIISYLHIVIGELAPKSWAIRQPEQLSLWTAVPLYLFYWLMYPAIYLLNASANAILRMAGQGEPGQNHEHPYSKDELKLILHSNRARDPHDQSIRALALLAEMSELEVADWANSKDDLICLPVRAELSEILQLIGLHKFSRYPLIDEHEQFLGSLHIKDLLLHLAAQDNIPKWIDLQPLAHPIEYVSRDMPLPQLLELFRQGRSHFALVVEGDGKVIGFLTMEDVLEVVIGDIQDEHRKIERGILSYQPGALLARGDTPLFKIERLLEVDPQQLPETVDTLAGLIYETLKRMPEQAEEFSIGPLHITITKMRGPKIMQARVVRISREEPTA